METLYGLKRKTTTKWLKLLLLLFVAVGFGIPNLNAQTKTIKVADNQQLIEAMGNSSIGTIELAAGYYAYLDYSASPGTRIVKSAGEGGNRNLDCQYYIYDANVCIPTSLVSIDPPGVPPIPPGSYYEGNARAGSLDIAACGCCPPVPNMGSWEWVKTESTYLPGDTLYFAETLDQEDMTFYVTGPGVYSLRYSWPAPYNSWVQTEYIFRGPTNVELSAPDVCGTETTVDFVLEGLTDVFTFTVEWWLDDIPYGDPVPYAGPQTTTEFQLTVPACGMYKLYAVVYTDSEKENEEECGDWYEIEIEFSCEPVADAGPDVNVCAGLCAFLDGTVTVLGEISPSFAYSWVNISGPQDYELAFSPNGGVMQQDVLACRELSPPECSYGEYEVQLQVQNGECYDDDNAIVRFYEQPTAIAGPDQHICNTFSFSLAAVPFDYCGVEGVNYWSDSYWVVVSKADPAAVITFTPDIYAYNAVVSISSSAVCPYGDYVFRWVEINSKGANLGGCEDSDDVTITIYEDPLPDAGDDLVLCDTWCFSLWGTGDEPCFENTAVVYHWGKSEQPGDCTIQFSDINDINPDICISNCDPELCPYGEYIFTLTQSNGYYLGTTGQFVEVCSSSDDVSVWILEPVDADAGPDQHICNTFAFTLTAVPTDFCGDEGVNYFAWGFWEQVSGPKTAIIDDPNDPETAVTINDVSGCPNGKYQFKWTEYNGFGTPFQGCWDFDLVDIYIYEEPEVNAGGDMAFCNTFSFNLNGTVDPLCTGWAYQIEWDVVSEPDNCDITFTGGIDPLVTITNCDPCQYGEYVFSVTQRNGYYDDAGAWHTVCEDTDEVSVWIYEQPVDVDAGPDQLLCNDYTFDLTGVGFDYCGDFGVNYNNWYAWTLVSQPAGAGCTITITNGTTLNPSVVVANCTGACPYGEFVFRLTEYNGFGLVYCEAWDEVSVFIFEQPEADAGDDVGECVDIDAVPYCYDMTGSMDYCYSMYGIWTKSCGPGEVVFSDVNDPESEVCFNEPGRFIFKWTVWNAAAECEDEDEVVFDLIEQPTAVGTDSELLGECDDLCIDLGLAGIDKYEYFGVEWTGDPEECPNYWDNSYWSYVSGPTGNPAEVTFADDTDPETELCVSTYGCYTVRWNEVNKSIDGEVVCSDYFDVFVQFVENPVAFAGDDTSLCGMCYTMAAIPFIPDDANCPPSVNQSYWTFLGYIPPDPFCDLYTQYTYCFTFSDIFDPNAEICVCADDYYGSHYGSYGFIWTEINGPCIDRDTVWITFNKVPDPVPLEGCIGDADCSFFGQSRDVANCGCVDCWYPEDGVFTVCANTCGYFEIDWECLGFGPIPGYTYEWSFIGPAGSSFAAEPLYYDCECGWMGSDSVYLCFGVCCDTARLYLTITSQEGCVTTEEWKFYVQHPPDATITGPEVAEVSSIYEYHVPEPLNPCYLYTWEVEHCGEIVYGQGTGTIGVHWTDYNENGGWGLVSVAVYDTCTCCCNVDDLLVQVFPQYTLGDATLSGHVYYQNNLLTPLNGVEIQLWNGGIPVMSTVSFNDIEGGNGVGYYKFPGINGTTNFGITATFGAPWYGANATDALAVELKVINALPVGFLFNTLVGESMDVNNSNTISATDALWIKQRAISMVNYFPAGNWVWNPGMSSVAGTYDIMTLNAGDANRSNIPASGKETPAIALVNDGTMNVVTGQVFELPIRIADANQFGAITLNLGYNSALIEIVDVIPTDGMLDNISNDNVSIAWSNVNPMVLAENDVVVTLKVKAISPFAPNESLFSIGVGSEFADPSASVIEPVTLKTFGITTEQAPEDYFLSANRPNPFNNSTFIEYTMPETGKVKLSVLDMLGQEIEVLVDATQSAGSYTVEFSAAGLSTGVYIYKITVDGETRDFISTQRMVISH